MEGKKHKLEVAGLILATTGAILVFAYSLPFWVFAIHRGMLKPGLGLLGSNLLFLIGGLWGPTVMSLVQLVGECVKGYWLVCVRYGECYVPGNVNVARMIKTLLFIGVFVGLCTAGVLFLLKNIKVGWKPEAEFLVFFFAALDFVPCSLLLWVARFFALQVIMYVSSEELREVASKLIGKKVKKKELLDSIWWGSYLD